jgi:microcystin-dependent protein
LSAGATTDEYSIIGTNASTDRSTIVEAVAAAVEPALGTAVDATVFRAHHAALPPAVITTVGSSFEATNYDPYLTAVQTAVAQALVGTLRTAIDASLRAAHRAALE